MHNLDTKDKKIQKRMFIYKYYYDIIKDRNLQSAPKNIQKQFSIKYYLISPNQQYIAIYMQSQDDTSYQQPDEILLEIRDLNTNKNIDVEDCWMDGKFDINTQITLFSPDSKYLILLSYNKQIVFIFDLINQTTNSEYISTQKLLSIDQNNNVFLLDKQQNLIIYSIHNQQKQLINFGFMIDKFVTITDHFALILSSQSAKVINQQNIKQLCRWPNLNHSIQNFIVMNKQIIIQIGNKTILRYIRTGKIIRNIESQKSSLQHIQKENLTVYLFVNNVFKIIKWDSKLKVTIKKEINQFIRFDILRGVQKLFYIDIDFIKKCATMTNRLYADLDNKKQFLRYLIFKNNNEM
ncbi:unnamed protein product [Paramecium sonneborni]|uniref:Uncharacterized protein n=1 Tax=Paramecium sonneborni TaxID=65129 RepID=A0A8S1PHZ8_9CILI|nr:unnamed protein product [Paramecium sonneborni]